MSAYRMLLGADDDVGTWVCARTQQTWVKGSGHAVGWTKGEILVAGVTYSMFNGANIWFGMALEESGWLNRASLWAIFHYPFEQLNAKRMSALINASNDRSIRLAEHLGFSREATFVDSAPNGNQHVYRMFARDCKWLKDLRWHPVNKREAA